MGGLIPVSWIHIFDKADKPSRKIFVAQKDQKQQSAKFTAPAPRHNWKLGPAPLPN
jgi:hypothetical protein